MSNRVNNHYIFIISQLRLTSNPRSPVVLLDTGTPGTSREIYSEDADDETRKLWLYEKPWACISWYGPCTQLVNSKERSVTIWF